MILLVFLICLSASTLGGICGIGGGVIIKPILDATGIMSVSTLSFLSGLTVLAMAVVNVWKNRRNRAMDIHRSLPLGIGAAAGGLLGKELFQLLKASAAFDGMVLFVQSLLLGLLMIGTLLYTLNKSRIRTHQLRNPLLCVLAGLGLGMLSAFLGIGGGPMNLIVLFFLFSMDTKQAAINSLLIILLSQLTSFGMTLLSHKVPEFDWALLIAMAGAGILGGFLSAELRKKMSIKKTDQLFSGLLVVIILICFYNAIRSILPI